ncbi:enoyl-CoA hydratase/isomerase family protein [Nocardioides acrostichi]|uniref:enoyl-CoA hydratase/isomerase family protein n=1 Tax=Nocardioides acrostichi TaxID=2784339 RepID=UPI001A9C29B8|nr:enoyl-CoA hydratase/isomerase family protein [Nocardioides acrostichi]
MNTPYESLVVELEGGVLRVTVDNPPVNVLDVRLMEDLTSLLTAVAPRPDVRVIVFDSADADFFIAHVDMSLIDDPHAFDEIAARAPAGLNPFQALGERLRHQPQATIVKLTGTARGGGAEFVAAADMAFAAIDGAALGQIESLMGIVPGGGGTQYTRARMGRNRALEVVLGGGLVDARTAERYGWVNRALPADELDRFVDELARNIADLPPGVLAAAKRALPPTSLQLGLLAEHDAWAEQFARPATERLIREGLATGAQTRQGERRLEELLRAVALD